MGYYMGDYYARGGRSRYMGDPGFFSFLGGIAKKAVGFIPGIGPAISAGVDVVSQAIKRPSLANVVTKGTAIVKAGAKVASEHPVLTAAGGASAIGAAAAVMHHRGSMAAAGMGGTARGMGGRRRRRMNACNPHALRRAIRRTHSFAKLAMKTIHLVHPKKKVLFGGFKKRRKK